MLFNVKNTTFCGLLDLFCPFICRGCGRLGQALCGCCKNDTTMNIFNFCPRCHKPIRLYCDDCKLPFLATFTCGWRDGMIGQLAKEYKYGSVMALADVLAGFLDSALPFFADEIIVVPLPTIARHIRERGFDHMELICQKLARKRGWRYQKVLDRVNNTVQVGASKEERQRQAMLAYKVNQIIESSATYLLVDDVWTTGSSMIAAEKILKTAGAQRIVAAVLTVSG